MMKLAAIACLLACVAVAVSAQDACNGQDYGTAGQFDF
jgi:hypothetical protein